VSAGRAKDRYTERERDRGKGAARVREGGGWIGAGEVSNVYAINPRVRLQQ
jgi:hypothetical protein